MKSLSSSSSLDKLRNAGNVHKLMKEYLKSIIRPGMKYIDICNVLETFEFDNVLPAFPTCISCDNVLAHESPTSKSTKYINYNNVVKIDFGFQCDGFIVDGAFTYNFNPVFDPLVKCSEEAVLSTIKLSRPDAILNELSENIKEIIESYELNIDGKIYDIRSTKNLGGHNIKKNVLHANKFLPGIPILENENIRMEENEIWAIEVFPTTGFGIARETDDIKCTNFSVTNNIYGICSSLYNKYNFLPFNVRWIENDYKANNFYELVNYGYIKKHKPLVDKINSYSAQTEHTIYVQEMTTEILT